MKEKLLLQQSVDGVVTIEKGSVPVIFVDSSRPSVQVVMTVNFLRNGSPAVQLLLDSEIMKLDVKLSIENSLGLLSLPEEKFKVSGEVTENLENEVLVVTLAK